MKSAMSIVSARTMATPMGLSSGDYDHEDYDENDEEESCWYKH